DRTTYALPLLGESPLCFYRADLFQAEANQAAFQKGFARKLAPPETWEEYADIAQFFHGRKEAGLTGPSLPPLPERDDDLDREFLPGAVAGRPAGAGRGEPEAEGRRGGFFVPLRSANAAPGAGHARVRPRAGPAAPPAGLPPGGEGRRTAAGVRQGAGGFV